MDAAGLVPGRSIHVQPGKLKLFEAALEYDLPQLLFQPQSELQIELDGIEDLYKDIDYLLASLPVRTMAATRCKVGCQ